MSDRSVYFGEDVPVRNLCVELRGYKTGEGPDENCAFRYGGAAGCSSWWDPSLAPPRFRQLQRTDSLSGSFAFVTQESGMDLMLAAYSHGGDYPTSVHFLQRQHHGTDDGSTLSGAAHGRLQDRHGDVSTSRGVEQDADRRHETYGIESGRLEVRINLAEQTGIVAELSMWSATARENDHSPCALENTADVDDRSTMWSGTRVAMLSVGGTSSELYDILSWGNRHDLTGGHTPIESAIGHLSNVVGHRSVEREGNDGHETSPTGLQLTELLRSSCSDYAQQQVGLWEANVAVCGIFRSALPKTEKIHDEVVQNVVQNIVPNVLQTTVHNLVVLMGQVRSSMGMRGIAEAMIAFGGALFLLRKLLSCLFGVSSCLSEYGYDHVSSARSAGGNPESLNDLMTGAAGASFDKSIGGVSQLASAEHREDDAMTENRTSDVWGRPTRVVANITSDGNDGFDAFSSMFSTLDDDMSSLNVASKEVSGAVPRQSRTRGSYVVFEQ